MIVEAASDTKEDLVEVATDCLSDKEVDEIERMAKGEADNGAPGMAVRPKSYSARVEAFKL